MTLRNRIAMAAVLVLTATTAQAALRISSEPTQNMSCVSGVCTPTARKAILNAADLAAMLATVDVKVMTGSGALTINVASTFSWTSERRLTLEANDSVHVAAPIVVAGRGAVSIYTNYPSGHHGDLTFLPGGKLDFWDILSDLVINDARHRLVNSVAALAKAIKENHAGAFALAQDYDAVHDRWAASPVRAIFFGRFEGLGHSIDNLKIVNETDECAGLFGLAGTKKVPAILRDIILRNADISSSIPHGGVGALAGCKYATVLNSSATGSVTATADSTFAGGLVGVDMGLRSGEILRSHADVTVSNTGNSGYAGGLIGGGVEVHQSYATGPVTTGLGFIVGGLAGECLKCSGNFATGAVTAGGNSFVGGLIGYANIVSDSYATGTVSGGGGSSVGGLVGYSQDTRAGFTRSYAIGSVAGGADAHVGGFMGRIAGSGDFFVSDYWDVDTSQTSQGCGEGDCTGVAGLTDAQLKSALPAGFDPLVWGQSPQVNGGYPYLLDNPPPQ